MEELQVISSEEIQELLAIGQGAYGLVMQGYHKRFGQIAIKKAVAFKSNPKQLKKLKEEAKKLSQLSHPNIVKLFGFVEDSGQCGIVLEFCKFGSLHDLLDNCECSITMKIQFLYEVVQGMVHLHRQTPPVIHRDLKACNVLIGENLTAKLADFGLSEWKTVVRSTSGNIPNGTVTHIPPEKWEDINFTMNSKCDVYSFSVLIWEMLMETLPFKDVNEMQVQVAVKEGQRPSLRKLPEDTPLFLTTLIERCWMQNPEDRPDFSEIQQNMEEELTGKDSYPEELQKAREDLARDIASSGILETQSLPTAVNISKNHSCRQLEPTSRPTSQPTSQLSQPTSQLSQPTSQLLPVTLQMSQLVIADGPENEENSTDDAMTRSNNIQEASGTGAANGSLQSQASSGSGAEGGIPVTVQHQDPISMINQKVYSIVDKQLGNNVVTDSIPFSSKDSPSIHYMREKSVPNKEAPPPLKGDVRKPKHKPRSSQPKGTTTIIQKGATGETIIHTNKVDGIQIGDRNYMVVGGGGGRKGGSGDIRSNPQKQQILKGKFTFPETPLDADSIELLCKHLGKYWRTLGRELGFSNGQLDSINADYHVDGQQEVIHQMLRQWKENRGMAAKTSVIGHALIQIGRPGTASMLCTAPKKTVY